MSPLRSELRLDLFNDILFPFNSYALHIFFVLLCFHFIHLLITFFFAFPFEWNVSYLTSKYITDSMSGSRCFSYFCRWASSQRTMRENQFFQHVKVIRRTVRIGEPVIHMLCYLLVVIVPAVLGILFCFCWTSSSSYQGSHNLTMCCSRLSEDSHSSFAHVVLLRNAKFVRNTKLNWHLY